MKNLKIDMSKLKDLLSDVEKLEDNEAQLLIEYGKEVMHQNKQKLGTRSVFYRKPPVF